MTREEAVKEIEKAFEPAFANYIITALTEGATASDKEQETCEDAVSVTSVFEIMGNLMSIPYDFDRNITEKDVSESMDKIRELPRVTPQEPFKPMVEIDLYSVIKQSYIEREVLDKIRAEIEARLCDVVSGYTDGYRTAIQGVLVILDKYKAESEET